MDHVMKDIKVLTLSTIGAILFLTVMAGLVGSAYADERYPYGSTWQVKCEQKEDGRQVQCWLVEVPNRPVPGIDTPLENFK